MEDILPSLLFSIVCDDVRREDNGKFILIGLFETIGAGAFPTTHPTLYIVNCWCSGLGTFRQKSRIVNKNGKVLIEDPATTFSLKDMHSKHKIIARFNGLVFEEPGEYFVEIMLNDDLKIRHSLFLEKIEKPIK